MAWMLRLVKIGAEGEGPCTDVMEISRPDDLRNVADLGLTLAEAKLLLAGVQREIVAAQAREHAVRRPDCSCCGGVCRVKNYRDHAVSTLFGQVTLRLPRFRCAACGRIEAGVGWPPHCRSTPELDRLQAHLSALMTYRTAADVLKQMFPVDAGTHPETLRRHTLEVGKMLRDRIAIRPEAAAAIVVTLDSTFIRSCENGERHLEVRVGNVETNTGGRQVFGAVAKSGTNFEELIRRNLDAVGRTGDTALTAFTDGCLGLRRSLADAGVTTPPMLDWFHVAMRLQHLKQIANGLLADDPARGAAKAVIVEEVERLHWRIWNGKAKDAQVSIDRIRVVMHHFRGEPDQRRFSAPSRRLWTPLRALDSYLTDRPERLAGQLRRAAPRGLAGWHRDHRRNGQLPGEPPDEQVTADALVATRRRPAAAGSLRRLQWHARVRLWTEIPASQRSIPANGGSRLTPNLATVPTSLAETHFWFGCYRTPMSLREPAPECLTPTT